MNSLQCNPNPSQTQCKLFRVRVWIALVNRNDATCVVLTILVAMLGREGEKEGMREGGTLSSMYYLTQYIQNTIISNVLSYFPVFYTKS